MNLYSTMTRRIEPVMPIEPGRVKIYSCGPTVYRYIHIGNLRTFTMADWLRRVLNYAGYDVLHIKNITDVGHMRVELLDRGEDKLIAQARKEGKTSAQIAAFYTAAFRADEEALNILPAHVFPHATDHISEMITIIEGLLARDMAYEAGGNVYYNVSRFPEYGKLSGNQITRLIEGVRDQSDPHKRHAEDFALWKAAEAGREMSWDSPWGRGFPGWHIECSAMSMKYLGQRFDIHTGGVDNIFPHHEDEIAQSEGYTGAPFVNIWVHAQHLLVDGLKMAKSTGNAYTRTDIEARGFEPLALRYLYTTAHYRSRINFTFTALRAAQIGLRRLRGAVLRLAQAGTQPIAPDHPWRTRFTAALFNDLNLPQAMATVWDLLRGRGPATTPAEKLALLLDFDQVLGFGLEAWLHAQAQPLAAGMFELPSSVASLVAERDTLRRASQYAEADTLRTQIAGHGFMIHDTPAGPITEPLPAEKEFTVISRSSDVPDMSQEPDRYAFSVGLISHDSRADLQRCIESIARWRAGYNLELLIVDNGSTDDTIPYLQNLARNGLRDASGAQIPLQVLFTDHDLGFAAARNAGTRASQGTYIVWLDTSIEVQGTIWQTLAHTLANPQIGLAGPYGLVTTDLQDFSESAGPDVDAVEGYFMAFRRSLLAEVGWAEEKFRFYRLLDIHYSFFFRTAGYRIVALPEVATRIYKHPHLEWYSLGEEERITKSKKNYDIFNRRWHHGQSLLIANFVPEHWWFGHNHPNHLGTGHTHAPEELPPPGQSHSHHHQHWPDHDHEHPHSHDVQT